jgi:HEPN domain-containing protein
MQDRYPPDDPREWLNRAHSNLVIAKNDKCGDIYPEDLCYNAQQAAEKTIKAVFVLHRIPYPYIHDLAALITILDRERYQRSRFRKRIRKINTFCNRDPVSSRTPANY